MQKTRMATYDDLLALKLWAKWSKQFKAFNDNNQQQTISNLRKAA